MKIWANCIVNNEENFIWFAIMSVVDYVDKVLVWDTGSTDKTVEIIQEIITEKGSKIEFKEVGQVDKHKFTKMRQAMLDESKCDWILVLDGDEIWWENSIKQLIKKINTDGDDTEGIVVPMIVPVGDIYHIQEEQAGQYELIGRKGHLSLRAINKKIPGLHVDLPYGKEGYFDKDGDEIQGKKGIVFINAPYLHVTHLKRSSNKRVYNKFKHEIGEKINNTDILPEVFRKNLPKIINSPWKKMNGIEYFLAKFLTPLRKIKRRLK